MSILTLKTYTAHLEELKQGLTEYYKERSEVSIKWYHTLGRLMVEYAEQNKVSLNAHVQRVGNSLKREKSTLYYMASLAKKFPVLEKAPFDQYTPWREICHQYLDSPREKSCEHEPETITRCKKCHVII